MSFDGEDTSSHTSFNKTQYVPAPFAIFSSLKVHINTTTTTSTVAYSSWDLETLPEEQQGFWKQYQLKYSHTAYNKYCA